MDLEHIAIFGFALLIFLRETFRWSNKWRVRVEVYKKQYPDTINGLQHPLEHGQEVLFLIEDQDDPLGCSWKTGHVMGWEFRDNEGRRYYEVKFLVDGVIQTKAIQDKDMVETYWLYGELPVSNLLFPEDGSVGVRMVRVRRPDQDPMVKRYMDKMLNFYARMDTDDGLFTIYDGLGNVASIGEADEVVDIIHGLGGRPILGTVWYSEYMEKYGSI